MYYLILFTFTTTVIYANEVSMTTAVRHGQPECHNLHVYSRIDEVNNSKVEIRNISIFSDKALQIEESFALRCIIDLRFKIPKNVQIKIDQQPFHVQVESKQEYGEIFGSTYLRNETEDRDVSGSSFNYVGVLKDIYLNKPNVLSNLWSQCGVDELRFSVTNKISAFDFYLRNENPLLFARVLGPLRYRISWRKCKS